jgi:predicted aspartyl protease
MRTAARRAVTAFALCAAFGQFAATVAGAVRTPSAVPVRQAMAGLLVVQVAINGRGEFPFLLDTGSESTLIDPTLAEEVGLSSASRRQLLTSTGVVGVGASTASLVFGAIEARDVHVLHMPLDAVRAYAPEIRGVLGHDVLRRSNWLLDYSRGTVTQDPDAVLRQSRCGDRLPLRWITGRPAVRASFGRVNTDLVLDSAASRLVLFGRADDLDATEHVSISSLSGREQVPAVTIDSLRLGAFVVPRLTAAVLTEDGLRREEGGIIPTIVFGSLYFDYRSDSVVVTPRSIMATVSNR